MSEVHQQATAFRSDYPEPLWIQALQLIRAEIDEGALQPGMRLPRSGNCASSSTSAG